MIGKKQIIKLIATNYNIIEKDILGIISIPSYANQVALITIKNSKLIFKLNSIVPKEKIIKIFFILEYLLANHNYLPKLLRNTKSKYFSNSTFGYFSLSEYIPHLNLDNQVAISDKLLSLSANKLAYLHKDLNIPFIKSKLDQINYSNLMEYTDQQIITFLNNFDSIYRISNQQSKIILIKKFIIETEKLRENFNLYGNFYYGQQFLPTHGDYSMVNILPSDTEFKICDWDNLALRPLIWELQSAISLFSMKERGNAFFMEPDYKKIKIFLSSYIKTNPNIKSEIILLPKVTQYNFLYYWLSYTLPALLQNDSRLLTLIPDKLNKMLYWKYNIQNYEDFIKTFI